MTEDKINWWWLSYADEEKGFKGAIILVAPSFLDACQISAAMGFSPGGQVCGEPIEWFAEKVITLSSTFRLLNKQEATKLAKLIGKKHDELGQRKKL